jgi:phage repressor protein C with HTH and peptisase S24 domain
MDNRVQAVRLKKKDYSLAEARAIVRALGYKDTYYGKSPFTQTDNEWRFRQFNPDKYKQYITRKKEGINYIIGVR